MLPAISPDAANKLLAELRDAAAAEIPESNGGRADGGEHRPSSPAKTSSTSPSPTPSSVPERWLDSLLLAQIAADAVHRDLSRARRAEKFWRRAAAEGATVVVDVGDAAAAAASPPAAAAPACGSLWNPGSHSSRLSFRSGPTVALERAVAALRRARRGMPSVFGGGRPGTDDGGADEKSEGEDAAAAVDAKIRDLGAIRRELERALCRIHGAAKLLLLPERRSESKGKLRSAEAAASECCLSVAAAVARAREASGSATSRDAGGERPTSAAAARSAAARPSSSPLRTAATPDDDDGLSPLDAALSSLGLRSLPPRAPGRTRAAEALAAVTPVVVVSAGSRAAAVALPRPTSRVQNSSSSFPALSPVPPVCPLPDRLRPPSWLQQRWLVVSLAVAGGAAALCLVARRSRFLGGDGSLERLVAGSASSARGAFEAHVVEPLTTLRAEMFSTLRDRRSIVTSEEFSAEKEALERMLADFERDVAAVKNSSTSSPAPSPAPPLPMARLMRTYEEELRSPVKNLMTGELARCLLIQLQKVKVDSASALLEMDQVLKSNELSLAATAAVPAVALVWIVAVCLKKALWPKRGPPPDPTRAAAPLRSAFADAEAALAEAAAEGDLTRREEAEGRALFELGRALAAVDALLGLGAPPLSPGFLARAAAALPLPPLLPKATPARAIGEIFDSSSSLDGDDDSRVVPRIGGGGGGALFASSAGAWRAGDAVRCRGGIVELALSSPPTSSSSSSREKRGDAPASASSTATSRVEAAARLARSSALLKQ